MHLLRFHSSVYSVPSVKLFFLGRAEKYMIYQLMYRISLQGGPDVAFEQRTFQHAAMEIRARLRARLQRVLYVAARVWCRKTPFSSPPLPTVLTTDSPTVAPTRHHRTTPESGGSAPGLRAAHKPPCSTDRETACPYLPPESGGCVPARRSANNPRAAARCRKTRQNPMMVPPPPPYCCPYPCPYCTLTHSLPSR